MHLSIKGILEELSGHDMVLGLFLAGLGMVFMLMGVRLYKAMIAISFGVIGFVLGGSLPGDSIMKLLCGMTAALTLAVISVSMIRVAVCGLVGIWAALLTLALTLPYNLPDRTVFLLAAIMACVSMSFTFIMFFEMIALTTSLEGSLLCIGGFFIFLAQLPAVRIHISRMLTENSLFGIFLVLAGMLTGFYLQLTELRRRDAGTA